MLLWARTTPPSRVIRPVATKALQDWRTAGVTGPSLSFLNSPGHQ
jgi:hypothetical protein